MIRGGVQLDTVFYCAIFLLMLAGMILGMVTVFLFCKGTIQIPVWMGKLRKKLEKRKMRIVSDTERNDVPVKGTKKRNRNFRRTPEKSNIVTNSRDEDENSSAKKYMNRIRKHQNDSYSYLKRKKKH